MGGPRGNAVDNKFNHFFSDVVCVLVPELSTTTYYFRNQLIAENPNVGLNSIVYIPVVLRENVILSWLNNVLKSIRFSPSTMMKLIIMSLLCLVVVCKAISMFGMIADAEWSAFKVRYNKEYTTIEEEFRKKVFVENKLRIINHNKQFIAGEITYALKINEFADMLPHEFSSYMLGLTKSFKNENNKINGSTYLTPAHVFIPKAVDWRKRGYVTPVKNQGQCGSCWAFSTTGSLEGQHYRKTGKLVSLSEQNLVDCAGSFDTHGCNGGLMDNAFQYIKENGGIDTESSYSYEAQDGTCRFNRANIGATVSGFVDVKSGDEDALLEAVATVGPVSVAIDASHESFQFYSHGVYSEPSCSKYELDHGVLVVGFGTDNRDNDYWIVKNSWGESWGLRGYIKMARNLDNNCGIATVPSYPLV